MVSHSKVTELIGITAGESENPRTCCWKRRTKNEGFIPTVTRHGMVRLNTQRGNRNEVIPMHRKLPWNESFVFRAPLHTAAASRGIALRIEPPRISERAKCG